MVAGAEREGPRVSLLRLETLEYAYYGVGKKPEGSERLSGARRSEWSSEVRRKQGQVKEMEIEYPCQSAYKKIYQISWRFSICHFSLAWLRQHRL